MEILVSNSRMYQVSGVKREAAVHSHDGMTHSHAHSQDHTHAISDTPMEELLALMKFMVNHNDAHAQELAELAGQLKDAGRERAYRKIMNSVADFDMVNAQLDSVVRELTEDTE